ncbi:MAG TPA: penicillin acylase family protein, partial [Longimicrobiales bacterium]|nr:penicillin acylase family protein [Longimicrobiales bacterium]
MTGTAAASYGTLGRVRPLRCLILPVAALLLAAAALVPRPSAAQSTDTLRLAALHAPVEIRKDRWGISHIYAETEEDLFFAQGWNAARDRLFQLELWRRRATGNVAEILGPRALERDRGTRLFRFRRNLEEELNHYHPRGAT